MNRFCVVFFVALLSSSSAEPPSISYGVPQISSGYSYEPSVSHASSTDYIEQHVGHQTSEGIHLDANLLHKIESVLVQHENSGRKIVSVPSSGYGVPQSSYGLPSHWSQSGKVIGIDFGHLRQSIPVAQYYGQDRYAHSYVDNSENVGWSSGNSGWSLGNSGWSSGNSGWSSGNEYIVSKPSAWVQPATKYGSPGWSLSAPKPSAWAYTRPSSKYGVPRW